MRVVQFHQALVDFFFLYFLRYICDHCFHSNIEQIHSPSFTIREIFLNENWSFCLANGCYSKETAWILLSYALSLLPHFGHSYNKTESLQFTSIFCPPTNFSLEIENSDFPKEYSLYITRQIANVFSTLIFINHELPGKKGGYVRLWIIKRWKQSCWHVQNGKKLS